MDWHGIETHVASVSSSEVSFRTLRNARALTMLTGMAMRERTWRSIRSSLPYDGKNRLDGILPEVASKDCIKVLVAAASSDFNTGEPTLSTMKAAISRGWNIVSMEKAPLVVAFDDLTEMAKKFNVKLRYSGATARAFPPSTSPRSPSQELRSW